MSIRCRCCDSPEAKWVRAWEDYYCDECLDSIYDSLGEFEEEEDTLDSIREMYYDD